MEVWHIPPQFSREIPKLHPLHLQPMRLTTIAATPEERDARVKAIEQVDIFVRQMVEQFDLPSVYQWVRYAFAPLGVDIPMQDEEGQP